MMKTFVVLLTIVNALSSQILPQLIFLSFMFQRDGTSRLIPFLIFYIASLSGLLVWIYAVGRLGSKRTFLLALWTLSLGLILYLVPMPWAIEGSAFLVGMGSVGVGAMMTTLLAQLNERSTGSSGRSLPLIVLLVCWVSLFSYVLVISDRLAIIVFLISLLLPLRFVRRLPFEKTAAFQWGSRSFVKAFLLVTGFTMISRSLQLVDGTNRFIEVFALLAILFGYVGWTLLRGQTRAYVSATQTRHIQFLAFVVGMFSGWTLIGAVFVSLALYDIRVAILFVFFPFLCGVIIWILRNRLFGFEHKPYAVLGVMSLAFFLAFWHPIAFVPILLVNGYMQTMYTSVSHVYLYKGYKQNKEFASLLIQFWKKLGMVVAYASLMLGLFGYGIVSGQSVSTELSFRLPKDWMIAVMGSTWLFQMILLALYGRQVGVKRDENEN